MSHRGGPTPVVGRICSCRRSSIRTTAPGSCRRARASAASPDCGSRASSAGSRSNRFSARLPAAGSVPSERPLTAVVAEQRPQHAGLRHPPGHDSGGVGRVLDFRRQSLRRDVEAEEARFVSGLGGDRFERVHRASALEHRRVGGQRRTLRRQQYNNRGNEPADCGEGSPWPAGFKLGASRKPPDPARGFRQSSGAIGEQLPPRHAVPLGPAAAPV